MTVSIINIFTAVIPDGSLGPVLKSSLIYFIEFFLLLLLVAFPLYELNMCLYLCVVQVELLICCRCV